MAEFDEAAHPRDEAGKFTDGGGGPSPHAGLSGATRSVAEGAARTAGSHEAKVSEHKAAAASRRAAADKEADPVRRSEHLAQAAHHEGRAAAHQVKADVEREVERAAVRTAHPLTEGLEAHAGVDRGPKAEAPKFDPAQAGASHRVVADHAAGSGEHGGGEKAAKGEHGEKGKKEGGHGEGGGIGHWLDEKLEGAREKLEGAGERVGRVEEAALGEGGLGEAARVAAGEVGSAARGVIDRRGEEAER